MRRAIVFLAGLGLLVSACGSSSKSPAAATTSSTTTSWVAFSSCMRSNGVSNYPDPAPGGGAPPKESPQQLGVSSTQFDSADSACRSHLPNGGQPPSQALQRQVAENALKFSQCVRAHGVANFPDPGSDGRIPDPATAGVNQGSPKFQAANDACAKYRPPYMPSNAAFNAYARTHP